MNLKFNKNYIDYYNAKFLVSILFILFNKAYMKSFEPIIWSTQNKMFETSYSNDKSTQKENIIEVKIGEFLNIVCPKYAVSSTLPAEYHALYLVSKNEYNECKIKSIESKNPILKCDRPFENVKYTLYISKFSPVPDAIEFTPGNSYYFISTSNGTLTGLANPEQGTCKSNNMKIIVKVLDPRVDFTTKKLKFFKKTSTDSLELQTRNIDPNFRGVNSKYKLTNSLRSLTTTSTVSTTKSTSTTSTSPSTSTKSKTVNDNIFILEPDTLDYNDILSQLISSSSSYTSALNNSDQSSSSDKLANSEPIHDFSSNRANIIRMSNFFILFAWFYIFYFFKP